MIEYKNYRLSRMVVVQDLVSADYFRGRHPQSRIHSHQSAWEMCVCMQGKIFVHKNGVNVPLEAGELIFIHPQTRHEISSSHRENEVFILAFTCNGEHLRPLQDSVIAMTEEMTELIHKLVYELKSAFVQSVDILRLVEFVPSEDSPLGAEQMICSYLEQFFVLLLRQVTQNRGKLITAGRLKDAMQNYLVEQVMAYIQEHIGENLSVAKIAEHFHYSRTHLSALFKSFAGISIGEYIVFVRIRKAKTLLLEQKKSIAQIAEETGFSSPQYFSHKFVQEVGCSPSRFLEWVSHQEEKNVL